MSESTLMGFVNNAAILLALGVLYDLLTPNKQRGITSKRGILSGIVLGCIGLAIMLNPWYFSPGVIFDSRSVLLSLAGLYFGVVPTMIAVLFTGLLRIYQGGEGALTGVCVIISSALIGLIWSARRPRVSNVYGWLELYLFGVTVHVVMLLWMFTLPGSFALPVLGNITLPVLAINPLGTVLLGLMLSRQQMRRNSERDVQKSEDVLRKIIQNMPVLLDAFDEQNRIIVWNRECERITGYSAEEMIGKPDALNWLYPGAVGKERLRVSLKKEQESFRNVAWDLTCKDGTVRTILWSNISSQYPVPGWYSWAVGVDVTDRILAIRAMEASEAKYRQLFQSMSSAFALHEMLCDASGKPCDYRFLEVNSVFEQTTGLTAGRTVGHTVREVIPGIETALIERYGRVALTGEPTRFEYYSEPLGHHYDITAYSPKHGQFATLFTDTTARHKAEEQQRRIERQLLEAQKLESLGVLAGGIAHDFNNLLMAMLGNLDLVMDETPPESPHRVNMEEAILSAKRAAELTRQMLAYSGKGRFLIQEINLSGFVGNTMNMLHTIIHKSINLNARLDKQIPLIEADQSELQQVLVNLVTNASEAIGKERGEISLTTGVETCDAARLMASRIEEKPVPGCFVWMEVSDTGCGMDDETLSRLFEPFFTTKFTGRGLGMSAVLGIVRGHHGAIFVESGMGKGSTVRILFPVACVHNESSVLPAPSDISATGPQNPSGQSKRNVLVIDDDEMVLRIAVQALTRAGFNVFSAICGEDALRIFREQSGEIDGVLLDLTMPGMDGESIFRALQAIKSDVRVILCSGFSEQEATQHLKGSGLSAFIQKPYSMSELGDVVNRIFC